MTAKEYAETVYVDLIEGYTLKLVSKDGFKMRVGFSFVDSTGEPYYTAAGIEGSEFATISVIFTESELERFIINSGFELYGII